MTLYELKLATMMVSVTTPMVSRCGAAAANDDAAAADDADDDVDSDDHDVRMMIEARPGAPPWPVGPEVTKRRSRRWRCR